MLPLVSKAMTFKSASTRLGSAVTLRDLIWCRFFFGDRQFGINQKVVEKDLWTPNLRVKVSELLSAKSQSSLRYIYDSKRKCFKNFVSLAFDGRNMVSTLDERVYRAIWAAFFVPVAEIKAEELFTTDNSVNLTWYIQDISDLYIAEFDGCCVIVRRVLAQEDSTSYELVGISAEDLMKLSNTGIVADLRPYIPLSEAGGGNVPSGYSLSGNIYVDKIPVYISFNEVTTKASYQFFSFDYISIPFMFDGAYIDSLIGVVYSQTGQAAESGISTAVLRNFAIKNHNDSIVIFAPFSAKVGDIFTSDYAAAYHSGKLITISVSGISNFCFELEDNLGYNVEEFLNFIPNEIRMCFYTSRKYDRKTFFPTLYLVNDDYVVNPEFIEEYKLTGSFIVGNKAILDLVTGEIKLISTTKPDLRPSVSVTSMEEDDSKTKSLEEVTSEENNNIVYCDCDGKLFSVKNRLLGYTSFDRMPPDNQNRLFILLKEVSLCTCKNSEIAKAMLNRIKKDRKVSSEELCKIDSEGQIKKQVDFANI